MSEAPTSRLAEHLRTLSAQRAMLFAGAGVGKKANLPDWYEYLAGLADIASKYEPETGSLMKKRIQEDLLPEAAHLYKVCPKIPEGERWSLLVAPFAAEKYDSKQLLNLVALPFKAIVTTNYDRSLHDAAAKVLQTSARPLELDDNTLRQGAYLDELYVARIHGRAEVPTSVVLDTDAYKALEANQDYLDFVLHLLTRCSCLFLGFSFLDPAIKKVLGIFEARVGPYFQKLHTAVLPTDATGLRQRLERYNITVLTYPAGQHEVLWEAIRLAAEAVRKERAPVVQALPPVFDIMKRFLAFCYARLKLAREIQPLRNIVFDGILIGLIDDRGGVATRGELVEELRRLVALTADEAAGVTSRSVRALDRRGIVTESEDTIRLTRPIEKTLEHNVEILVSGVLNRLIVREAVATPEPFRPIIRLVLQDALLERGWDLGAHFAAARASDTFDVLPILSEAVRRHTTNESERVRDAIVRSCYHLVSKPHEGEASVLVELGRVSFGISLAVERTRGLLLWRETIPHRLYLDANVLLPVIVPGHKSTEAYQATLTKLSEAAERSGVDLQILVSRPFLNEVISHRAISRLLVSEHGLQKPRRLEHFMRFAATPQENVFLSAYAAVLLAQEVTYSAFLQQTAPYETEDALQEWLLERGIHVVDVIQRAEEERAEYNRIRLALHRVYSEDEESRVREKPGVLIDHEAQQLWLVHHEARSGLRSVFVTGDNRLRRLVSGRELSSLGGLTVSPLALIQLVDVMIGITPDPRELARVMWAVKAVSDETELLRGYFTERGLRHYFGEAFAKGVPELISAVASQIGETQEAAEREGIRFRPPETTQEIKKMLRFMETIDEGFEEKMAKEIKRRED